MAWPLHLRLRARQLMRGVMPPNVAVNIARLIAILLLCVFTQVTVVSARECDNIKNILGVAVVSFDSTTVLRFFAKPDSSKQPVQVIRFFNDSTTKSLSFRVEGNDRYSWLRPESHKLDYFIFELLVRSRRNGWLEVVVDQTGKTLWVGEGKTIRFTNWLSKMRKSFAVGRIDPASNPLRITPAGGAIKLKLQGPDCLTVARMTGDWIRVIRQNRCDGASGSSVVGWIRWRSTQGCLLISIFPFA
jgi:hypothetical protein